MNLQQSIFAASLFGFITTIAWWLMSILLRKEDDRLRQRLRNAEPEPPDHSTLREKLTRIISRMGHLASAPFMPKSREAQSQLRRQLGYAGLYSTSAFRFLVAAKLVLLVSGLVGGYFVGASLGNAALGVSLGGILGYRTPVLWLGFRMREHQKCLQRGLPDALDLLIVCVEAGLTVDAAMQRVGQEIRLAHPRLAHELETTHMETRIGVSRADALRNLGQRTGNAAVQALSVMLIQAERFGTSIAAALRVQADALRSERQHAAEEQAAKASVKLTFPVVLFIFPAVLIVLAGPAAIGLFKSALFAD